MSLFHFLRPNFLLLFVPFFITAFWLMRSWKKSSAWDKICSQDLLPHVIARKGNNSNAPYLLMFLIGSLLIMALAGPSWELKSHPLMKTQSGLVVVLDLSPSMNAEDIKPSRLQRAIYKLTDILNMRHEGQTALVVFSENPYVVTPLTDDVTTIKTMLPVLETNIMPSVGHNAGKAVEKAYELLVQAGVANGSILLIGSELSFKEADNAIEFSVRHKIPISILGVGTEAGAPIPKAGGGFLKDEKGALIMSTLAEDRLTKLAKSTGGTYISIRSDDSDIQILAKGISGIGSNYYHEQTQLNQNRWHDAGYWLVLAAIPLLTLLFRRGILNVLFIFSLFVMPPSLHAFSWNDLWKTPDQQAEELFHQEEYQEAKELFQNPDWKGAANYRLEDYEAAAEMFQQNTSADGYYNHGTAKAKQGDYEAALESYAKALEIQPDHEDALYNKKIIEELMQQQEQNKDNQNQDKDKQDDQTSDNQESKDENQEQKEDQNSKPEESKDQAEDKPEPEESKEMQANEQEEHDPQRQMDDRWLQKVTDDPGGLLRRKFLQQYRQQTKR